MKTRLIFGMLLATGFAFAQTEKPVLEREGSLVKATYFHDNGKIKQQGYFSEGKLEGTWVAFDENGTKISSGDYRKGQKTGKWFFWGEQSLAEVDYLNNRITSVKNWKQDAIVNK